MAMQSMRIDLVYLLLLCGCAAPSPWCVDAITSGTLSFDSTRLRYTSLVDTNPYITFEVFRIGDKMEAFLNLTRPSLGKLNDVEATYTIDNQEFKEKIKLNEGRMRLRLSEETTNLFIDSLQEGKEIAILINGCEETLDPGHFGDSFTKFQNKQTFIENLFKRPLQ